MFRFEFALTQRPILGSDFSKAAAQILEVSGWSRPTADSG
jgi:hypothetical protein